MNDLDLSRGPIKVMSTIVLHLTLNISETVRDRDLVPKDHQLVYQMVTSPMTSQHLWGSHDVIGYVTPKAAVRQYVLMLRSSKSKSKSFFN